jgi:hypothetical protein
MSARYHSSAPKGTFFGWNREPRSASGKGVTVPTNWVEEIRDPVKLEHLLSTKGFVELFNTTSGSFVWQKSSWVAFLKSQQIGGNQECRNPFLQFMQMT